MNFDFHQTSLGKIYEKIENGARLSFEDGMKLYQSCDLTALGALAQIVRRRFNANRVYYSVNLHINHTNVCAHQCLFCSFSKRDGAAGAYTLSLEDIRSRIRDAVDRHRINEVHIVGGHNPALDFDYYLAMLRMIREEYPALFIKAFSAPEIYDLARRSDLTCREVLSALKEAGLGGLPGGGAEIFSQEIRAKICKDKIDAGKWLEIHRAAHALGLESNATMLYGHIEKDEDRVDHVLRLRALQDETRGFRAFIPLAYHPENNLLGGLGTPGGVLDLKVFAVSRLLLDNIAHVKAHWTAIGLKLAQVALSFGVDDLGGTNLSEKILHEAGSKTPTDLRQEDLEDLILSAGYEACLVDSSYQNVIACV